MPRQCSDSQGKFLWCSWCLQSSWCTLDGFYFVLNLFYTEETNGLFKGALPKVLSRFAQTSRNRSPFPSLVRRLNVWAWDRSVTSVVWCHAWPFVPKCENNAYLLISFHSRLTSTTADRLRYDCQSSSHTSDEYANKHSACKGLVHRWPSPNKSLLLTRSWFRWVWIFLSHKNRLETCFGRGLIHQSSKNP